MAPAPALLILLNATRSSLSQRRGLDLSDWRGLLDFRRRIKIKLAAVT